MTDIPKEEMQEWLGNPTTKKVMKAVEKTLTSYQDAMLDGKSMDVTSVETTALQTANILGIITGIRYITTVGENE